METMNKKGTREEVAGIIVTVLIALISLVIVSVIFYPIIKDDARDRLMHDEWNNFCNERPAFCYCDRSSCNFHIEYNNDIPSKETKEYCELAKELNDKKALFTGRCEQ